MSVLLAALWGGAVAEAQQLRRSRLLVALTLVQAVTFLILVSLFGLTGSRAPTALIDNDQGPYAQPFTNALLAAHHSFTLVRMDPDAAMAALRQGHLVAIITIPANFSTAIAHGQTVTLDVAVDNVNTDMTEDIQRALPSAIVAFGQHLHLPDVHVQATEVDLIAHDTDFIPYLVVSALILDAFLVAATLGAFAVAREFETGTASMLAVAPVHPLASLAGRMLMTDAVAAGALAITTMVVIVGYHVLPLHPLTVAAVLLVSIGIFGCVGVALGALLKRSLPVAAIVFGIALPSYLCGNALEPSRFDGNLIWMLGHLTPLYYGIGVLQDAFLGLRVTPEPVFIDFLALLGWAFAAVVLAGMVLRRRWRG